MDVNTILIVLPRAVADSLLRCLKYYELDNLSPQDERAIIEALEKARINETI